ncbi:MAG: CHASE2 domain-containing protein, partial [Candidatus Riflebacteria bacterium]
MTKTVLQSFLAAFLVVCLLYFSSASNFCLNYSYDIFISLKNFAQRAENVVIIGIDKDAFEKYSISSSGIIPRRVYAELIDQAIQYKPSVLAFDVIFERRITSTDDSILFSSLASYSGPIVMSSTFQESGAANLPDHYVEPWKDIANPSLSHGYVNIFRGIRGDFDSIRRFYLPYAKVAEKNVLSLPLSVV